MKKRSVAPLSLAAERPGITERSPPSFEKQGLRFAASLDSKTWRFRLPLSRLFSEVLCYKSEP